MQQCYLRVPLQKTAPGALEADRRHAIHPEFHPSPRADTTQRQLGRRDEMSPPTKKSHGELVASLFSNSLTFTGL